LFVQVLADVAEVLSPLAEATELLTTETTPAAGSVYFLLKELAEDLAVVEAPVEAATAAPETQDLESDEDDSDRREGEAEQVSGTDTDYDSPVAARLKTTIWDKLQTRFNLELDGQPEVEVCESSPLLISAFCDPRYFILFTVLFLKWK